MSGISVWDVLALVCWISADGRIVVLCHPSPGPLGRELQSALSAEVAFGCCLPCGSSVVGKGVTGTTAQGQVANICSGSI